MKRRSPIRNFRLLATHLVGRALRRGWFKYVRLLARFFLYVYALERCGTGGHG